MRNFRATQQFAAPPVAIADAYRTESTWRTFRGLPFVGDPALVSFDPGPTTSIAMAYRVSIELPAVAKKFIEPDKMTFVEVTRLAEDGSGTFDIVPDHYKKLLKASGKISIEQHETGCQRHLSGTVDISLGWAGKLFEGPVEEAIVDGLVAALEAQAQQVALG